ncbi:hypothetical protein AURDEDRAFT_160968 [Auricularia subglabra TFB-10046 SS5]|nr:hypothetical protein AURDEDRAFT_160968 [Auricularia subglabra TFB-10046 SS5]
MTRISTHDALPHELVRDVLSYCDPSDWHTAALVSKGFQHDADTLLYRDVRLSDGDRCAMLRNALERRPLRAQNVNHLCLRGTISGVDVLPLLLNLPALTTLEVVGCSFNHQLGGLPNLPFQLRKLAVSIEGAALFAQDWASLVEQQHESLESLELSFDYEALLMPLVERAIADGTAFLPKVHTVESTPDFLLALLRGGPCPLKRLTTHHAGGLFPGHPPRDFADTLSRAVSTCTANITALRLGAHNPWETLVVILFSGAFPRLQSLELMMATEVRLRKLLLDLQVDAKHATHARQPCLERLVIRLGMCHSYSPRWLMRKTLLSTMQACIAALKVYVHDPDATPSRCFFVVHYLELEDGRGFWSCRTRTIE